MSDEFDAITNDFQPLLLNPSYNSHSIVFYVGIDGPMMVDFSSF